MRAGGRFRPALILLVLVLVTGGVTEAGAEKSRDGAGPEGTASLTYVWSGDREGPGTGGLRLGSGFTGRRGDDDPWGEFWISRREGGNVKVTSAGLAVVPRAILLGRFEAGWLVDLGLSRRREDGKSALAGIIGGGLEGAWRLSTRWDLVSTAEVAYRTTAEVEFQARAGIRFRHPRLRWAGGGP